MCPQDFAGIHSVQMRNPLDDLGRHRDTRRHDGSAHFLERLAALMKELADEIIPGGFRA